MAETEHPSGTARKGTMRRMLGLLGPYKWTVGFCCLLGVLLNLAELVKPYIMEIAIDRFLTPFAGMGDQYAALAGENWFTGTLIGLGVSYFLMTLLSAASSYAQSMLISGVCQRILHNLRMKLSDHIHRMKLVDLDHMGSGRLLTRSTNDVEALDEFYGGVLMNLFKDVFLLIGIVAVMLRMNWQLALVGFATLPLIALVTLGCKRALHRNFVKMKMWIGRINGFIAESLSGIRVIQAFNREEEKYDELYEMDREYRKTTMFQVFVNSFMRPMTEVINSLGIALILIAGFKLAGAEVAPLEVGVLVAFNTYIKKFFEPINDLAENYNTIQSSVVSADRVFSLLEDDGNLEDLDAPGHSGEMKGSIEFRDVWFAYEGENWVLRGLSFRCEAGDKIAFVGATGAGKTTIISLLSRFYVPQKGEILVDGVPLNDWQLEPLRRQIAVVLQDVFLFVGTIADNVRIHAPISDEAVRDALEKSCALDFVDGLQGGLHHMVAERGATFSTGERQLISFARAIAHDPKILVLDEATANIDSATEAVIQKSIRQISEGRTAVFIAHRLSTIRNADCIYYMEKGVLTEQGTHEELMAKQGKYYALVSEQAG
ncbi:MAG: ABC transporter ATP-binding protein [Clostridia bacterium]|nr:ABC transporter ATP-binding protein [Clostridia bacterium]